ncbi:alanine--glyoxylate and serine--pyruvate aminotransferase b [Tachysurus ichikawai]
MFNRKTKPVSYLLDMTHLSNYWGNDGKSARMYHHTGPVSGFFTLRESLAILTEKGLENSWRQHREVAEYLWKGLEDLGLKLFIKDKDLRLPSVTTIAIPEGYDWKELLMYMMKHHQMEMTGGLGPSIGLVMRVGLMGYNCSTINADKVLAALADTLKHCKKHKA